MPRLIDGDILWLLGKGMDGTEMYQTLYAAAETGFDNIPDPDNIDLLTTRPFVHQ